MVTDTADEAMADTEAMGAVIMDAADTDTEDEAMVAMAATADMEDSVAAMGDMGAMVATMARIWAYATPTRTSTRYLLSRP